MNKLILISSFSLIFNAYGMHAPKVPRIGFQHRSTQLHFNKPHYAFQKPHENPLKNFSSEEDWNECNRRLEEKNNKLFLWGFVGISVIKAAGYSVASAGDPIYLGLAALNLAEGMVALFPKKEPKHIIKPSELKKERIKDGVKILGYGTLAIGSGIGVIGSTAGVGMSGGLLFICLVTGNIIPALGAGAMGSLFAANGVLNAVTGLIFANETKECSERFAFHNFAIEMEKMKKEKIDEKCLNKIKKEQI